MSDGNHRPSAPGRRLALGLLPAALLALAACGRKGDLELPPGARSRTPAGEPTGTSIPSDMRGPTGQSEFEADAP